MTSQVREFSVLMSVYAKENPIFFREAMASVLEQTLVPNQIVLVCDGPLTEELNRAALDMQAAIQDRLLIIRLKKNSGLGIALNEGIKHCTNEYIARMDTDDLARPDRFEKQIAFMSEHELDLCSGTVQEFSGQRENRTGIRKLPITHEEIVRYAKRRNPMNHPAVMMKKDAVEAAGGYRHMPLFEDYDLWIRMLQSGAKAGNLRDVLLDMRSGKGMYQRRGGVAYLKNTSQFFENLYLSGFISKFIYCQNVLIRSVVSVVPNVVRAFIYQKMLR